MRNYRKSISVEKQSWVFEWQYLPKEVDNRVQKLGLPIKDARIVRHFKEPQREMRVAVDDLGDLWIDKNHPDRFLYKPFLSESLYHMGTFHLEAFDHFIEILGPTRLDVIKEAKRVIPILRDSYGINQDILNKICYKYNWKWGVDKDFKL